MENSQQKIVELSGDEFMKISEIAKTFWENGSSETIPKFVVFTGGIGSGKTTIRRQKFSSGYVNFDFGEIYLAIQRTLGENDTMLANYAAIASDLILNESIDAKKNIVIEITGSSEALFMPVLTAMKKIGYKIAIEVIMTEPDIAYERHLKAAKEDKDYISSYFTEVPTLSVFYQRFNLGDMPNERAN